jgi:hypothetical protein
LDHILGKGAITHKENPAKDVKTRKFSPKTVKSDEKME